MGKAFPRIVYFAIVPTLSVAFAEWYLLSPAFKSFVDIVYGGAINSFTSWVVTHFSAEAISGVIAAGAAALLKIVIPVLLVVGSILIIYGLIRWMRKGRGILPPLKISS